MRPLVGGASGQGGSSLFCLAATAPFYAVTLSLFPGLESGRSLSSARWFPLLPYHGSPQSERASGLRENV